MVAGKSRQTARSSDPYDRRMLRTFALCASLRARKSVTSMTVRRPATALALETVAAPRSRFFFRLGQHPRPPTRSRRPPRSVAAARAARRSGSRSAIGLGRRFGSALQPRIRDGCRCKPAAVSPGGATRGGPARLRHRAEPESEAKRPPATNARRPRGESASQRVGRKLAGREMRQEARGVDIDGMASRRSKDRQASADEEIGKARRRLGAVAQIGRLGYFQKALGKGFEVAAGETAICRKSFGGDQQLAAPFGPAPASRSAMHRRPCCPGRPSSG